MFHNRMASARNGYNHEALRSWKFKKCSRYYKDEKNVAWGSFIKSKEQFLFQQNSIKIAFGCFRKVR